MRMKSSTKVLAGALLTLLVLIGCDQPGGTAPVIENVLFEPDGSGAIKFRTNDATRNDVTWYRTYNTTFEPTMTTVTATVKKTSGSTNGGAGILFCYVDASNYYMMLITPTGYYTVQKRVAGVSSPIVNWTLSPNVTGLNTTNTLRVTHTASGFDVYINNLSTPVANVNDTSFLGGLVGFAASVGTSTEEQFPSVPVDVRFQLLSPVPVP